MSKLTTCALAILFLAVAVLPSFGQGNHRKRAVSKARGEEIVRLYRHYAAQNARADAEYRKINAWIQRYWWEYGHTEYYQQQCQRRYAIKRRLDVIRDRLRLLKAEYYGVSGGWAAPMSKGEIYSPSPRCPRCRQRTTLGRCYNPRCPEDKSTKLMRPVQPLPSAKSSSPAMPITRSTTPVGPPTRTTPSAKTTTRPKSSSKPCPKCGYTILCTCR